MITRYENVIIQVVCGIMVPFIQLFGLYVVVHGHYGPGGGFQGGVIFAVSVILLRVCLGKEASSQRYPTKLASVLATIGMLVFLLAGLIPMTTGGAFLDYGHLPIPGMMGAALRSLGILIVECGIALAVFGTLVVIFDYLVEGR